MGGNFNVEVSRETTAFTMTVRKEELANAVNFLGDVLSSSLFDKNQMEAERDEILRASLGNCRDQMETTIESIHYTSFRDHFIGQPSTGIRENLGSVT